MSSQQESNQSQPSVYHPDTSLYPLCNIHHDRRIFLPRDRNNLELPSVFRPTPLRCYWYNYYGTEWIPQRSHSQLRPLTYHPNASLTAFYDINYDRRYDIDSNRINVTETFPAQSSSQMPSTIDYNYARSIDYYNYSDGMRRLPFQGQKQLETFIGSNNTSNDTEILPPNNSNQVQSFRVHENSAFTPYSKKNNDVAMSELEKKNLLLSSVGEGSDPLSTRFSSFNITDIIRPDNENNHAKSFIGVNNVPSTSQSNSNDGLKASHSEGQNLLEPSVGSQNVTLPKSSSNNNSTHIIPSHNNNQLRLTSQTSNYNNYGLGTFSQRSSNEMLSFIDYNYVPSEADYNHIYGTRTFQSQGQNQLETGNGSNDASLTPFYGNNNYGTETVPLRSNNQVQTSVGYNKAHSPSHSYVDDTLVSHSEDHNQIPSTTDSERAHFSTYSSSNSTETILSHDNNQIHLTSSTSNSYDSSVAVAIPPQNSNQVKSCIDSNTIPSTAHCTKTSDMTLSHSEDHNELPSSTDTQNASLATCSSSSNSSDRFSLPDNNQLQNQKPFQCQWCKHSFFRKSDLKNHTRIHTGETPYECEHCDRSFTRKYALMDHIRTHTGEKPFKCKVCERIFARKRQLMFHAHTHSQAYIDARPFACPHCDRRYKSVVCLYRHKREHTDQNPDQN